MVNKGTSFKFGTITVVIVGMICLALFFRFLVSEAKESADRLACAGHITRLKYAIYYYYRANGTLPPAFTVDENGQRMHSWRVLVEQYDGSGLLDYDFNKAWNDPKNRDYIDESGGGCVHLNAKGELASPKELEKIVYKPYACPSDKKALANAFTNYVAIVGEETLWPGKKAYKLSKGDYDKILLIELPGSDIKWTEPRDITVEEAVELYRETKRGQIRAGNPHLLYITLGGKYGDASSIPDEDTFRKMLTVGKPVK